MDLCFERARSNLVKFNIGLKRVKLGIWSRLTRKTFVIALSISHPSTSEFRQGIMALLVKFMTCVHVMTRSILFEIICGSFVSHAC